MNLNSRQEKIHPQANPMDSYTDLLPSMKIVTEEIILKLKHVV